MKELVVLALALSTASSLDVEHQPRDGGVDHQPREVMDISFLENPPAPHETERKARQVDGLACGSTDTLGFGEYVTLESPRYPRRYPNNVDCSWELIYPAGAQVLFSCEYFHVKRGDYFTLDQYQFDGYSSGFSGQELDFLLDTQTSINLGFTSNRRRRGWGFRCFVEVEAGNSATTTAGTNTTAGPTTTGATTTATSGSCSCGLA